MVFAESDYVIEQVVGVAARAELPDSTALGDESAVDDVTSTAINALDGPCN
jgi:hypothetical protein